MNQDALKQLVARAALDEIRGEIHSDTVLGIGTGTTADRFIDLLAAAHLHFDGAVASSQRSAERLAAHGIALRELTDVDELPVYVDGADEITLELAMIKGGGGALTREKIVAAASRRFVCIADGSKLVERLGAFGLPVEVIPMARRQVARALLARARAQGASGQVEVLLRSRADGAPFVTDNGNLILDVRGLAIDDPAELETEIDGITGVVCNGLFARRGADVLLLAKESGIERHL